MLIQVLNLRYYHCCLVLVGLETVCLGIIRTSYHSPSPGGDTRKSVTAPVMRMIHSILLDESFLLKNFFYVFNFWLWWAFIAFSSCSEQGLLSGCRAQGFSLWCLSSCMGFSSCGLWVSLLCGIWNLPRSGMESVPPALASRFPSIVLPGKSSLFILTALGLSGGNMGSWMWHVRFLVLVCGI